MKELRKHTAVLVLSDGNLGRVHRVLQAGRGDIYLSVIATLYPSVRLSTTSRWQGGDQPVDSEQIASTRRRFYDQSTRREIDLLRLLADGYQVKEIANRLGVTRGLCTIP